MAIDTTKSSILLSWSKPSQDGGCLISEYLVQMMEIGSDGFCLVDSEEKITSTQYEVKNLKENENYQFRIVAVNDAGQSEPSEESDVVRPVEILNEPDFVLDANMRQTVTVRAGNSIRLFVSIKGRPSPAVTWDKKGGLPKERCSIETTSSYTLLLINDCCRDDGGKYSLLLQNVAGYKEVTIFVKVLDSPSAVRDLQVVDVTRNSAYIQWDKPVQDGGSTVSCYIVERRPTTRKSWNTVATDVMRESYRVMGLIQGEEYFFRVMAENKFGIGVASETLTSVRASEVRSIPISNFLP